MEDATTAASGKEAQQREEEDARVEEEARAAAHDGSSGPSGAGDGADEDGQGGGEIGASAYYSDHDLREMFSRENAKRRREGGHTLRRFLSEKQDKQILNHFVKLRETYAVANNNDIVIAWAKMMIEDGKEEELDPELIKLAKRIDVPKRSAPWDDEKGH